MDIGKERRTFVVEPVETPDEAGEPIYVPDWPVEAPISVPDWPISIPSEACVPSRFYDRG